MNESRVNRGIGNGGKKYRESPFWDNLEKKKEKKDEREAEVKEEIQLQDKPVG